MLRLKCFVCESLARALQLQCTNSPLHVDVEILDLELHNKPWTLHSILQEKIDAVCSENFDAIALGYGLCGQAISGLRAHATIPMVIPRAHDCVTLCLGSRTRYLHEFEMEPGTFWLTADLCNKMKTESWGMRTVDIGLIDNEREWHHELEKNYGKDMANYIINTMEAWQKKYTRIAYIDFGIEDTEKVESKIKACAVRNGWKYEKIIGDIELIRRLVWGEWDSDFLIVPPKACIVMSLGEEIITTAEGHE